MGEVLFFERYCEETTVSLRGTEMYAERMGNWVWNIIWKRNLRLDFMGL